MNNYEHTKYEVEEVVSQLKNTQYSRAMFLIRSLFNSLLKESEERYKLEVDIKAQRESIHKLVESMHSIELKINELKNVVR